MLKDKLKEEVVAAVKNKDSGRSSALRYLVSILDKREMQLPPGQFDETMALQVLQKELKNKEESKQIFGQAGRAELVAEVEAEIAILKEFLPKEISEAEVGKVIEEIIARVGNNFPAVMKEVMGQLKGRISGEVVTRLVKEKLTNG